MGLILLSFTAISTRKYQTSHSRWELYAVTYTGVLYLRFKKSQGGQDTSDQWGFPAELTTVMTVPTIFGRL